tara:strand:+ start:1038 stop:1238 length:201 start_codon:yes stop_codon:yes gene_type:complete
VILKKFEDKLTSYEQSVSKLVKKSNQSYFKGILIGLFITLIISFFTLIYLNPIWFKLLKIKIRNFI